MDDEGENTLMTDEEHSVNHTGETQRMRRRDCGPRLYIFHRFHSASAPAWDMGKYVLHALRSLICSGPPIVPPS